MKTLFTLLLAVLSFGAVAQRAYVSKEIEDNGKRLRIRVDAEKEGRKVHFKRDFDATGLSQEEKDQLVSRLMDSLGVAETPAPKRVAAARPKSRTASAVAASSDCEQEARVAARTEARTAQPGYASSREGMEQVAGRVPYQKLIREDRENGRLWMHFEYRLDGEEHVFERTINTEGKTDREKKRLIEETERSLGLGVNQ
ncbi:hypothetical protein [Tellurirhabdus rosea]|uniref:hypothetical protein n=1 Tax=Tellurirhabdus rosea TaxID=2674997 RepID=UPI00225ABF22|nr:hypothetical protein [Tellurirhabdus rosea]